MVKKLRIKESRYIKPVTGYEGADAIIKNFRFSGDWFNDFHNLEDDLTYYYCNEVQLYSDPIRNRIKKEVYSIIVEKYPEYEDEIYDEFYDEIERFEREIRRGLG